MKLIMTTMARTNSERLPGKNTRMFCGKPLLEWCLLCGHLAENVTDIYVTVDSIELARIVEKYGIPIFQPEKSTHYGMWGGPVADAYLFRYFYDHGIPEQDRITTLPTAPLKRPCDFDGAIDMYEQLLLKDPTRNFELVDQAPMGNISMAVDDGDFTCVKAWTGHETKLLMHCGAFGVQAMNWWIQRYGYDKHLYKDVDKRIIKEEVEDGTADLSVIPKSLHHWKSKTIYFYQMPVWACHDIDDIYEWNYCEWAFEKYILNEGYYG